MSWIELNEIFSDILDFIFPLHRLRFERRRRDEWMEKICNDEKSLDHR